MTWRDIPAKSSNFSYLDDRTIGCEGLSTYLCNHIMIRILYLYVLSE